MTLTAQFIRRSTRELACFLAPLLPVALQTGREVTLKDYFCFSPPHQLSCRGYDLVALRRRWSWAWGVD